MIRGVYAFCKCAVLCALFSIFTLTISAQNPEQIIEIDLANPTLLSYSPSDQDGAESQSSIANTITEGGQDVLELQGNTWKAIEISPAVTLTPGAILQFDFKSTDQGEWQGLGFETDLTANNPPYEFLTFFKVYGTDNRNLVNRLYDNYSGSGDWKTYSIPVENVYEAQGTNGSAFPYLVFFNDNDNTSTFNDGDNGEGNAFFRNVSIILPAYCDFDGDLCDFNGNGNADDGIYVDCECQSLLSLNSDCENVDFNIEDVLSYQLSQDDDNGITASQPINCGAGLMIIENSWKSIDFNYNVTQNTVLEVEFKSTQEGEIHAIGLDSDNEWGTSEWGRIFHFYGTQDGLGQNETFYDYPGSADADGWSSYTIPLLDPSYSSTTNSLNLGAKSKMFFIGDDDESAAANSMFRNIRVYEEGECSYEDGTLCESPFIAACPAPIVEEADISGTATPSFMAEVEGTGDITVTYFYLGNEVIPGVTPFEVGTHQIIAVAENECGSAVCQCVELIITCFDADDDGICFTEDACPQSPGSDIETCGDCESAEGSDGFAGWTPNVTGPSNESGQFVTTIQFPEDYWVLYANSGQTSEISRTLSQTLEVNGELSVEMRNGSIDGGGTVGVSVQNSNSENLAEVYFIGGNSNYFLNDADGQQATGVPYTSEGLDITFKLLPENAFELTLTDLGTSANTQTLLGEFNNLAQQ
ncbi:MAG TPA: hypothetical protein VJ911_08290, partial [Cryomorphaceae bacterium]|nr:hypothetical protein [Cryomorphaceae bacterium]